MEYAINVCDMTKYIDDLLFQILIEGKLTKDVVYIQKNRIDGSYAVLNRELPIDQLKATCQLLQERLGIRCYFKDKKGWIRVK